MLSISPESITNVVYAIKEFYQCIVKFGETSVISCLKTFFGLVVILNRYKIIYLFENNLIHDDHASPLETSYGQHRRNLRTLQYSCGPLICIYELLAAQLLDVQVGTI